MAQKRLCLSSLIDDPDDGVLDDFPKVSDHFPKILENLSEGHTNDA